MWIFAFVHDSDLVDRDVRNFAVFITQIENSAFYIDHITTKGGIGSTRNIDLFTQ